MNWCGIELEIPPHLEMYFPPLGYEDFPLNFCGAGSGIGEWIVPDTLWTGDDLIKLSPACAIHDTDWVHATPTWDYFHESNSRLYTNIKSIILAKATTERSERFARRVPALYAHAVDTAGRKIFWTIKKKQGYGIPKSAAWLLD
jgi:hypothetical protein